MAGLEISPGQPGYSSNCSSWTRANLTAEGGEDGTPAGTVWFAWHIKGQNYTAVMHFAGDCETVLASGPP
ncbi:hypothetical protein MC04F16_09090 [Escherichia coli]